MKKLYLVISDIEKQQLKDGRLKEIIRPCTMYYSTLLTFGKYTHVEMYIVGGKKVGLMKIKSLVLNQDKMKYIIKVEQNEDKD